MASRKEPVLGVDYVQARGTFSRSLTLVPVSEPESDGWSTTFHPGADLEITIQALNGSSTVHIVCASALACASPVWRSMLECSVETGREGEGTEKYNRKQTMELTGDPKAFSILFSILHYDFCRVPTQPRLDQLFELSTIVSQYKCAHVLWPWTSRWMQRLRTFVPRPNFNSYCHKVLYVAWVVGDMKLFRETVDVLIMSASINSDGKIVNNRGNPLEDMLMPAGLLDIIAEARASTLAKILDAINQPIHKLTSGEQGDRNPYCKIGKDIQGCKAMMLGSTIPALSQAGLYAVSGPENFKGSIESLKVTLDNIKTEPFVGKGSTPHTSHENCNLGFRESFINCLQEMTVSFSVSMMDRMSERAEICGIKPTPEIIRWRRAPNSSPA